VLKNASYGFLGLKESTLTIPKIALTQPINQRMLKELKYTKVEKCFDFLEFILKMIRLS